MAELGNHNTVFTSFDQNSSGDGYVLGPFGAGISGTITGYHLRVKPGASASKFRGLIYAASGSDPGALLWTGVEHIINDSGTDPTERWENDAGLSIAFTGPIYIGFWQGPTTPVFQYSYDGTGAGFYSPVANFAAYSTSGPPPDPWPASTDTPTSTQKVATYVDYTPSAGAAFELPSPLFESRRPMPMMRGPDMDHIRFASYQGRSVSAGMPRFDAQSFLDFTSTNSWTHTPVGTPRGVVVLIAQNVVSTDLITGVTYGGVAMTRVPTDGLAQDTVGEPGAAYAYFLGSNIPTGPQTVAVTVSSGTDAKTGWAVTLTGDCDQAIAASGKVQADAANPSVTLATNGHFDGTCLSVLFSGSNAPTDGTITAGSGYTKLTASAAGGRDFGNQSACAEYANLTGANIACGWTAASDDVAMISLAVKRSP